MVHFPKKAPTLQKNSSTLKSMSVIVVLFEQQMVIGRHVMFEPSTAEDSPPQRRPLHIKYVEAQTSSRWCGGKVRRWGASSGVVRVA
ncbi:hypothetical protein TNCV_1033501 [Trichonephila clavipes]|nr:hypothetical protein TNCV_1033501 [Trichonephila clavipes]